MFKEVKLFKILFALLQLGAWVALGLAYLASYVNPATFELPAFAGLAHIWILLGNIFLAIVGLIYQRKWFIASAIFILAGLPIHQRNFAFNISSKTTTESIKVMSWNIQLFKLYNYNENVKNKTQILDFISAQAPHIVCLQEFYDKPGDAIETSNALVQLKDAAHYHFEPGIIKAGNRKYGIATFSKHPILNKGKIVFPDHSNRTNMGIYTDIKLPNDTVRVFNIQLASNHLNTKEVDSILGGGDRRLHFSLRWLKKLRNGYHLRSKQVKLITDHITASPYPVILCGDFNDVPVSYTYHQISNQLTDCFTEAGFGLGATYNGKIPNLRIDYIFSAPQYTVQSFKVLRESITDHFAVVTELAI